ncbi:UNVERIFIED_CONTAM: hypothetical protein FKN15_044419 [Acipenser sinensis]
MERYESWLMDASTPLWLKMEGRHLLRDSHLDILVDFVCLKPSVMEALEAMTEVVDWVYEEAEQSREEPERPAPKREEPECPAPKRGEPERPAPKRRESASSAPKRGKPVSPVPKRGEAERPEPKRRETASSAPKRGKPVSPEPNRGEAKRVTEGELHQSPVTGDYLLLPLPLPDGDYPLLVASRGSAPAVASRGSAPAVFYK